MHRTEVLSIASDITMRDRNDTHGDAEDSFTRISYLWSAYLATNITPRDVAMLMVLLKVARAQHSPTHDDHYIDIAGYAALASELDH